MVPDLLYNMMACVLSTKSEYSVERVSDISPEVHRLALSLSQELKDSATRGRIKTPKHVVLTMTVNSLTGNVELITILNRFGHGLSYSQTEEVETALAEMQIAKRQNGVFVSSVCYPNVPGVFCWDNNDSPSQPFLVSSRNAPPHKRLLTFKQHSFPPLKPITM